MMKINIEVAVWNFVLYVYSAWAGFFVVQHAVYIYGKIDPSRLLVEPWYWYFLLGFIIYCGFKLALYAGEKGRIFAGKDDTVALRVPRADVEHILAMVAERKQKKA